MKRTIAIASLAVGAGFATTAWADSPQLKGAYAFTGTAACLVAPGNTNPTATGPSTNPTSGTAAANSGFNANLQPNDAVPGAQQNSFTRSFQVFGVRTFFGNGHGRVNGSAIGIDGRPTPGPNGYPHFPPSASAADFSFTFTYTEDGHGGFTATMDSGSYSETFTAGPRTGQTATVDAIPAITGAIAQDGNTLVLAQSKPAIETRTFSNGDVWPEICHRSRALVKLQSLGDHEHDGDQDHDGDPDH